MSKYNKPAYITYLEQIISATSQLTNTYGPAADPIHNTDLSGMEVSLIRLARIITNNGTVGSLFLVGNANLYHATNSDRNTAADILGTLNVKSSFTTKVDILTESVKKYGALYYKEANLSRLSSELTRYLSNKPTSKLDKDALKKYENIKELKVNIDRYNIDKQKSSANLQLVMENCIKIKQDLPVISSELDKINKTIFADVISVVEMLESFPQKINWHFIQGKEGVHAEFKLLPQIIHSGSKTLQQMEQEFLATSKLLCRTCYIYIDAHNKVKGLAIKTPGTHSRTYALPLPEDLG